MLILLSPAKSMDYKSPLLTSEHTLPRLIDDAAELVQQLRQMSPEKLGQLMSISDKLAALNAERYVMWEEDFSFANSRQAILAFTGDVYQGLELSEWSEQDYALAQKQLRILSGLYGVLRPLDLMQPYRLEMGTKLENKRGKNLYAFWQDKITHLLNADLRDHGGEVIVNLASNEYFKSVNVSDLNGSVISPVFKDQKNGVYKIISFYAKKARGMMADYLIRNKVDDLSGLIQFNTGGYVYSKAESTELTPVFLRKEQKK